MKESTKLKLAFRRLYSKFQKDFNEWSNKFYDLVKQSDALLEFMEQTDLDDILKERNK